MRIVVGVTGATGAPIAVRLLQVLGEMDVEVHLVVSRWARATLTDETGMSVAELSALAAHVYKPDDQGAAISSGSFPVDGMVIVPCSMKTLAAVRIGFGESLISRAADVTLKERRPLILVARETPLSTIHLENMLEVTKAGATVFPPVPAFYNDPHTVADLVDHLVARILDQLRLDWTGARRWTGMASRETADRTLA
ncbi:UbiX family flavin prenyltransferase [Gordonia sp. PDNC005]|uniref:UbiX family flavin prenyltransferase n=1 Tax=unclassified Gordonia (in: high G+C Gram-positive bacteria) TaxID=2657482 RepID=UPI001965E9FB|nr:UbiX family flavin prenyltransferase [Gordonia sp. PDNC005]QRY61155.1 UbiX family flavin prenyltransferase [Gordonia sp. PDNC005]